MPPAIAADKPATLNSAKQNSYLVHFDRAWQNLRLWKEDQRKKRINNHRNKQLR
jgi:hypothetical protein